VVAREAWFAEHDLKPDRPALDTPLLRARAKAMRARLAREVDFPGINDPKTALVEALDRLRRIWGVDSFIHEGGFKLEMLNDAAKTEVANPTPIPPMRAQLHRIVEAILARIPVPSEAAFVIVGDHLMIGTNAGFQQWGFDPEPRPRATEKMKKQFVDFRTALTRAVSFPGVFDPKATLGEVLDRLAKDHGLKIDIDVTGGPAGEGSRVQQPTGPFTDYLSNNARVAAIVHSATWACVSPRATAMDCALALRVAKSPMPARITPVRDTQIAASRPIPAMKAPLGRVLQVVLDRVTLLSDETQGILPGRATYILRPGGIVVTVGPADVSGD
jgi:hypothetical protein